MAYGYPYKNKGFYLDKATFWDSVYLRYGFEFKRMPNTCGCGKKFDIEHALNCAKGGYISLRHNEIRDITAELMTEVCKDVQVEPKFTELSGERFPLKSTNIENDSRLDISARSLWGRGTKAYIDVRVFNPTAKCYQNQSLAAAYVSNEKQKKREYNQRVIEVEHGSFTPVVFSCFGGMSRECSAFYKRLAQMISDKRDQPYHEVSSYIRTRLCFSLLRVATICIRGWRGSSPKNQDEFSEIDIPSVVHDAKINSND